MINIREKGAAGERKVATDLNVVIYKVMRRMGLELPSVPIVQRNQNQSAVGGGDLTNTFGLCIEVKCQETLAIGTWWNQCETAANRNQELPVLLYKQNRKGFKCVTMVRAYIEGELGVPMWVRAEMSYDDFLKWFEQLVEAKLRAGYRPKI